MYLSYALQSNYIRRKYKIANVKCFNILKAFKSNNYKLVTTLYTSYVKSILKSWFHLYLTNNTNITKKKQIQKKK